MSKNKQSESLHDLLAEVTTVRRAAPEGYEQKLKRFLKSRARQMENGIFDGEKLPTVKPNVGNLQENLRKNRELTERAQCSTEQYLYAKNANEEINNTLMETVDALKEVAEIERSIRNDGTHWL